LRAPEAELPLSIELRARVSPSEDPAKVLKAMENVLNQGEYLVNLGKSSITITSGTSRTLEKIRNQLRDRRVRGAARRLLISRRDGKTSILMLNRQAAFSGIVALCGSEEESPLGPIYLRIESERLEILTDWLTAYP